MGGEKGKWHQEREIRERPTEGLRTGDPEVEKESEIRKGLRKGRIRKERSGRFWTAGRKGLSAEPPREGFKA